MKNILLATVVLILGITSIFPGCGPDDPAVPKEELSGVLSVEINGVPSDESADVSVTGGGGYRQQLTASAVLRNLKLGDYVVAARNVVTAGGDTLIVTPPTQTIAVAATDTARAQVNYSSQALGSLNLTVSGLPGATDAAISVSGSGGFLTSVTASTLLSNLIPGDYTIQASDVTTADNFNYKPVTTTRVITVGAGVTSNATVTYEPIDGKLEIVVAGLPAGSSAEIEFYDKSNSSFHWLIVETETTDGLIPGIYRILAEPVIGSDSEAYEPYNAWQDVTVVAGQTASTTIEYARKYGKLQVNITGLPTDLSAEVNFSANSNPSFQWLLTETTLTDSLEAGPYTVFANQVPGSGGRVYQPEHDWYPVVVVAGETATVNIVYSAGFFVQLLHGPIAGVGSGANGWYIPGNDPNDPRTYVNDRDPISYPYPNGYVTDSNCRIIGTDITATGISLSSSQSSIFGNGTATALVHVESDTSGTTVVIETDGNAVTNPMEGYICDGAAYGQTYLGFRNYQTLHDIAIGIENPDNDILDVHFEWACSGSVSPQYWGYWEQVFEYLVNPPVCLPVLPTPTRLFRVANSPGPSPGVGSFDMTLPAGDYSLLSFSFQSVASANVNRTETGAGNNGTTATTATVTIKITRRTP